MRALLLVVTLLVLVAWFVPAPAAAQGEQRVLILHDVKDDGYTYVGNPTQFGWILMTGDKTNVHKDAKITIHQNDVLLYETGGTYTAHDYDALNSFVYAFPTEGPYRIRAEVAGGAVGEFTGYVHRPAAYVEASIKATAPSTVAAGTPVKFVYEIVDASGARINHSDALFEVRRAADNWLLFRVHTHTHEEEQAVQYAFAEPGQYVVRLVGYNAFPTKNGEAFLPVSTTLKVNVGQAATPIFDNAPPPTDSRGADGEDYVLLTTYDPSTNVGPFGNIRLNTLVYDPTTKAMVAHVDFKATLKDTAGRVLFTSETLHEYDGNLEVVTQNSLPGDYKLAVTAERGEWTKSTELAFKVIPPVVPVGGVGPVIIQSTGLDKVLSGTPTKIGFTAKTLAGTPQMHSEIEIQAIPGADPHGPPFLINKLHSHGEGRFDVDLTFPAPGKYVLLLDVETLDGEPTPSYHYKELNGPTRILLDVAEGVALPNVPHAEPTVAESSPAATAPGLAASTFLVAAFVAVFAFRRHR